MGPLPLSGLRGPSFSPILDQTGSAKFALHRHRAGIRIRGKFLRASTGEEASTVAIVRLVLAPVSGKGVTVPQLALYVPMQAKPGKEKEVADCLRSAPELRELRILAHKVE